VLPVDPVIAGFAFASSTGLLFGLHDVCVRLARLRSASSGVLLSLLAGYPLILALAALLGGFEAVSLKALAFYVAAGVLNFSIGRVAMYISISRLGAGVASILISTSVVYNLVLGVALGEDVGLGRALGSILILAAVAVASWGRGYGSTLDFVGVAGGLLAGLSIALSILLGRLGNIESGNPIAGVFIAYTSGLLAELTLVGLRNGLEAGRLKGDLGAPIVLAGLLASAGQAARYLALMYVGVTVVTPLQNTRPIVATLAASTLSRRTGEQFNLKALASAILAAAGSALIFL